LFGGAVSKLSVVPESVYEPEPPIEACLTPSIKTARDVTEAGVRDRVNAVVEASPVNTSVWNDVLVRVLPM